MVGQHQLPRRGAQEVLSFHQVLVFAVTDVHSQLVGVFLFIYFGPNEENRRESLCAPKGPLSSHLHPGYSEPIARSRFPWLGGCILWQGSGSRLMVGLCCGQGVRSCSPLSRWNGDLRRHPRLGKHNDPCPECAAGNWVVGNNPARRYTRVALNGVPMLPIPPCS